MFYIPVHIFGLNQNQAEDKMSCVKIQHSFSWESWDLENWLLLFSGNKVLVEISRLSL